MSPSVHARPGLRLAQDAEHAALEIGSVGASECERTAIGLAVLGIINLAVPLAGTVRFHCEHDRHAQSRPVLFARISVVLVGFRPTGGRIIGLLEPNERSA